MKKECLALEDVAKVAAAIRARDFNALHAIRVVHMASDGAYVK